MVLLPILKVDTPAFPGYNYALWGCGGEKEHLSASCEIALFRNRRPDAPAILWTRVHCAHRINIDSRNRKVASINAPDPVFLRPTM
jgi:hypothetical protein